MRSVALVGCGKLKSPDPVEARGMYTSQLVRKSLALAEVLADEIYLVSAEYGLLDLKDIVEPYERCIREHPSPHAWGYEVVNRFAGTNLERGRVYLFMGAEYADPIIAAIRRSFSQWLAIDLMRGMQVGERLQFLKRVTKVAHGA